MSEPLINTDIVQEECEFSLVRSLEPLRRVTYWLGILPDWCRSVPKRKGIEIANALGVVLNVPLVIVSIAYLLFQFYVTINESASIHGAIPVLVWSFCSTIMLYNQIYFILYRKEMMDFFVEWTYMDKTSSFLMNHELVKFELKIIKYLNWMLFIFVSSALSMIVVLPYISEQRTSFIYHDQLRQIFTDPVLLIVQCCAAINVLVIQFMGQEIPTIIHLHAAIMMRGLNDKFKKEIDTCLDFENKQINLRGQKLLQRPLLCILSRYGEVCRLVNRTNHLLGLPLLACHTVILAWLVLQTYSLLKNFRNISWIEFFVIFGNLSVTTFRIIVIVFISNNFERASTTFKSTLNEILVKHMIVLRKHEYCFVKNFLLRITANSVFVSPLNLYPINLSLLLKFFGMFVSFILILLQS